MERDWEAGRDGKSRGRRKGDRTAEDAPEMCVCVGGGTGGRVRSKEGGWERERER